MVPFCFQKGDLVWYTDLFRLRRWYLTIPPSDQWIAMVDIDNHRKPLLPAAFTVFLAFRLRKTSLTYSFCDLVTDFGSAVCVQSRKLQFSAPSSKFGKSPSFTISSESHCYHFFVNCHCHGTVIMIKWLGSCPWSCDHLEWQIWVNWNRHWIRGHLCPGHSVLVNCACSRDVIIVGSICPSGASF